MVKLDTVLITVVAAAGLYVLWRKVGGKVGTGTVLQQSDKVNAVSNTALPGDNGWGWQYYSDGTAIGPDGRYYFRGSEVYNPAGILKA